MPSSPAPRPSFPGSPSARPFFERVRDLPWLGLGVSTEYGAAQEDGALDVLAFHDARPDLVGFLEVGVEVAKGLDRDAQAWAARGLPTTYHFLDINLDEPEDLDPAWLLEVRQLAALLEPAWLCGDAGLWHLGRRERGHMLLLPPILSAEAASAQAGEIRALREGTGYEILPENPPGLVYVGPLHILELFAQVAEEADTGLVIDCAHLAIFQRLRGHEALAAMDSLPLDRVVELHMAGGHVRDHEGYAWVDDDHSPAILPETWTIFEHLVAHAPNLKAVIFECERNGPDDVLVPFERMAATLGTSAVAP